MAAFTNVRVWVLGLVRWILLLLVVLPLGEATVSAAELTAGPEVTASTNRATVRWQTDVPTGARVRYGAAPDRLDRRAEGPVDTRHAVALENLRPGTRYFFTVGTARVVLATNLFTTPTAEGADTDPVPSGGGTGVGTTASPTALPQAPPARVTWGNIRTLSDHFQRHGADFGARDAEDYARQAWLLRERARRDGLPAKRDTEGVLRVYDPASGAFAAYNRDGTTRTFFKPGRRDYFADQPGVPVDLKREEP